jgi:hypothetical protein
MGGNQGGVASTSSATTLQDGLRKTQPYWYEFQTYAKLRWFGRELIEIMTTEFRDRTKEYYVWAIHKGICTNLPSPTSPSRSSTETTTRASSSL